MPFVTCVTGASGFLGREISNRLQEQNLSVVNISLRPADIGIESIEELATFLRQRNVGLVVNCAAARFNGSLRSPEDLLVQANVLLPTLIAHACSLTGIPMIQIGSRWQLGEHGEGPNGPYAYSKQEGEERAQGILEDSSTPFASILIRDTYGLFDPRRTLVNDLLEAAMSGIHLPLTDGYQKIDPLPVRKVADSVIACGRDLVISGIPGRYEVGSSVPPTVRELVSVFEQCLGFSVDKEWGAMPPRGVELFEMTQVLPWAPGWEAEELTDDFRAFVNHARDTYSLNAPKEN